MARPSVERLTAAFRDACEAAGLTQEQIAEALGVHQTTVSKWLLGKTQPPLEHLPTVEALCGLPIGRLLRTAGFVSEEVDLESAIDADPDLDASDKGAMHLMLETLRGRASGGRSDPDSRPTAGELRQRLDRVTGRGAGPRRERPA